MAVDIKTPVNKVVDTSWLKDAGLKYSFLGALVGTQILTGMTEGYHFNGNTGYLVTDQNYHAYETLKRAGYITTGWTLYANLRSKDIGWFTKTRRIIGGILISRLAFETAYRWERYNSPFDNLPEHNRHAIVYFKFTNGNIQDAYIGTGKTTTPLADIGILLLGIIIFK
jgi:hypothetical protein